MTYVVTEKLDPHMCNLESRYPHIEGEVKSWRSLVPQQVKNLALALQQPGCLLWHSFNPWFGNFGLWNRCGQKITVKDMPLSGVF